MSKGKYKPQTPDVMEAVFDAGYLIFDLVAGILFFAFSKGNDLFVLYGILTLTLCGGDAFHLVPRIIRAVHGSNDRIKKQLGIRASGIIHYNDGILYHSDVYMETYFPGFRSTGCIGSCYMDLCDHQDRYMHTSAE